MLRNTTDRWGSISKFLHWTLAGLIVLQTVLGIAAVTWSLSPVKLDLFVWHKSFGMLILLLVVARLTWRFLSPPPQFPSEMKPWEHWAAHAGHALLYLLMLVLPLSGWVINSAVNIPVNLFWLVPLPAITQPNESLGAVAKTLHLVLFASLALIVVMHIAAALRHHFLLHDQILIRMLPSKRNRP